MKIGRLPIQFQRFGANFADRWPRWTGARLIEVHLHSESFGGTLKWPLKGGSRLIEVTATAGLTVLIALASSKGSDQAACKSLHFLHMHMQSLDVEKVNQNLDLDTLDMWALACKGDFCA